MNEQMRPNIDWNTMSDAEVLQANVGLLRVHLATWVKHRSPDGKLERGRPNYRILASLHATICDQMNKATKTKRGDTLSEESIDAFARQ